MRFLARALGLFLAAGTFVAVVVDGTRSIADNAFVYLSIRQEFREQFDDRILEETAALRRVFEEQGRDRLSAVLAARGSGGGALAYGLWGPGCTTLAGELRPQPPAVTCADSG